MSNDETVKENGLIGYSNYVVMSEQQMTRLLMAVTSSHSPAKTVTTTRYMPSSGDARIIANTVTTTSYQPTHGRKARKYGNATALGILSFLMTASPMSAIMLGWGLTGPGSLLALDGAYFFYGGLGLWVAALFEWLQGNTFALVNFAGFGSFWLAYGFIFQIPNGILGGSNDFNAPPYTEAFAIFLVFFGLYCFVMALCAMRVNVVFVLLLSIATFGLWLLAASYFARGRGHAEGADKLLKACGVASFMACLCGWYAFFSVMMESMDFAFQIPVGDLTLPLLEEP